jgi:hypothetical protein
MSLISFIKKMFQWFIPPKKLTGNSYILQEFMKYYKRMQVHVFIDSLGNRTIDRCAFTDCIGRKTEVYIAKILQSYTIDELKRDKDKLFIKTLSSGNLCLCKKWKDVEMEGWET